MKTLVESLTQQIESMNSAELVELNNAYCQAAGYNDGEIYYNDEDFFNLHFENRPIDAVRAAHYGDYNYMHEYVKFNGYANLESLDNVCIDDLVENVSTIIDYAIENQNDFSMLDFEEEEEENDSDYSTDCFEEAHNYLISNFGISSNELDEFYNLGRTNKAIEHAKNLGYDIE